MAEIGRERGRGWPEEALVYLELFGKAEGCMKRGKFIKNNKRRAEADWTKLARWLGDDFFNEILQSNKARTLIDMPPKAFLHETGWENQQPRPIDQVEDLFIRGICSVRNNLTHGDKYIGTDVDGQRDTILIKEATFVLQQALDKFAN